MGTYTDVTSKVGTNQQGVLIDWVDIRFESEKGGSRLIYPVGGIPISTFDPFPDTRPTVSLDPIDEDQSNKSGRPV